MMQYNEKKSKAISRCNKSKRMSIDLNCVNEVANVIIITAF